MRLLLLLLLFGCTYAPEESQSVKLTLVASSAQIGEKCGKENVLLEGFGCAKKSPGSCEIVAVKPRSFDDAAAIKTLGHELWHCFHGPVHD